MREWRILNFDHEDFSTPDFAYFRAKFKSEAVIYYALVSEAQKKSELAYREKHGLAFPYTFDSAWEANVYFESNEMYLRALFEELRDTGIHIVYQVKPPRPVIRPGYRICKPYACMKIYGEGDGARCEYEDNSYCLYEGECPFAKVRPEFSESYD